MEVKLWDESTPDRVIPECVYIYVRVRARARICVCVCW